MLVGEVGRLQERSIRQPVAGRDDGHQLVVEQTLADDLRAGRHLGGDGEIERFLDERLDRTARGLGHDLQLDLREVACHRREHARQPVVAGIALRRDAQDALLPVPDRRDVVLGAAQLVEHDAGGAKQPLALGGGLHAARAALEQLHPKTVLEIPQRVAHRRLREVKALGGAAHAAFPHDGVDHAKMTDFENHRQAPGQ